MEPVFEIQKNKETKKIDLIFKDEFVHSISKRKKIIERIKDSLLNSSINGLPNIFRVRNLFLKIMWSTCFFISICAGSYYTVNAAIDYLRFSTITVINVIHEQESQFPTISFCSSPEFNTTLDKLILSINFERIYITNLSHFEEFKDISYGKCYRYNSGKNIHGEKQELLYSSKSGFSYCLRINLYHDVQNYEMSKLLINIHNHSSPPYDMKDGGYWVRPGTLYYFEVERTFFRQLEEPYSDCLNNISLFKMNKTLIDYMSKSNLGYSQNNCFRLCANLFALEESNCNCNSTLDNFERDCSQLVGISKVNSILTCILEYLKNFRKNSQYTKCYQYCPLVCDSLSYNVNINIESFPPSGNITDMVRSDYSYLNRFNSYEEVYRRFIGLRIYYKDLKYILITHEPKTETFNFISNIGGIFGLFLGVSFLSFIEIFEIIVEVISVLVSKNT